MKQTIDRPLDLLNSSKGKKVLVNLKGGREFVGTLVAFDIHINVVLENATEIVNGEQSTKFGITFFKGDTIIFVSPSN